MTAQGTKEQRSYADAAVGGSALTLLQLIVNKGAAAAMTFAFGYLLTPEEFGVAWFALSAGVVLLVLQTTAYSDVLLASPRSFAQLARPVFRLAMRTAAVQAAITLTAGAVLAHLFPDRRGLFMLMAAVAVRPIADSLSVVPISRLKLGLEYRTLSRIDGWTGVLASSAAVAMAWAGMGALSIVLPPIATTLVRTAFYRLHTGPVLGTEPGTRRHRALFSRFSYAALGTYLNSIIGWMEPTILGFFVDERSLGIFAFAFGLAVQANIIIAYQVGGALQPIFSHLQREPGRQVAGLLRAVRMISALLVPVLLVQAALGGPIFRALWPGKWDESIAVFEVLSVGQAALFCQSPSAFVLRAQGRFKTFVKVQLLNAVVAGVTFACAAKWGGPAAMRIASALGIECTEASSGPLAVALCSMVLLMVFGPIMLSIACSRARVSTASVLDVVWRPWLAAVPVAVGVGVVARLAAVAEAPRWAAISLLALLAVAGCALGAAGCVALHASTRVDARALLARVRQKAADRIPGRAA